MQEPVGLLSGRLLRLVGSIATDFVAEIEELDPFVVGEGAFGGVRRFEDVVFGLFAHQVSPGLIVELSELTPNRDTEDGHVSRGGTESQRRGSAPVDR